VVLARANVGAQQAPDHDPSGKRANANLWKPAPGDAGAHGDFDDEATAHSPALAVTLQPGRSATIGVAPPRSVQRASQPRGRAVGRQRR